MKLFIYFTVFNLVILALPPIGHAQPDMAALQLEQFAQNYRQSCIENGHDLMNEKELEGFCSCAAYNIKEKMTYENILSIMNNDEDARFQNNRITFEVYMPCMGPPISQIVYKDCAFSAEMKKLLKDQRKSCTCIANTLQSYVVKVSEMDMLSILQNSEAGKDPMSAFVESQQFNIAMKDAFESCQ